MMNYLEQIVAFSRWKEVNPLPASANCIMVRTDGCLQ